MAGTDLADADLGEAGWITGQVIRSDGGHSWVRAPRRGGELL